MYEAAGKDRIRNRCGAGDWKRCCTGICENGADLAVLDINAEKLAETAKEIEALGRKCYLSAGDVSDEAVVKAFIENVIAEYGKIDVLTHCAGILRSCAIIEQDTKDWDAVIAVNLRSSFLFSKYVGQADERAGERCNRTGRFLRIQNSGSV